MLISSCYDLKSLNIRWNGGQVLSMDFSKYLLKATFGSQEELQWTRNQNQREEMHSHYLLHIFNERQWDHVSPSRAGHEVLVLGLV